MKTVGNTEFRISVVYGGTGSEREVSIESGKAVLKALEGTSFDFCGFEISENRIPSGLDPGRDILFPLIHGLYGEDGQLAAESVARGFSLVGSGPQASVLSFDKLATSGLARQCGVRCSLSLFLKDRWPTFGEACEFLGSPIVLKPRRDGSSVGLRIIRTGEEWESARRSFTSFEYLAERYISGKDLTVGILKDEPLGVVGVVPSSGVYDYTSKYTPGATEYEVPADIPSGTADQIRETARKVYRINGCRDFARADFRIDNGGNFYFLEINTLPGMTPTSLFPKSASIRGIDFSNLVLNMVQPGIERWQKRVR